jgi:uncharacterized protein (TIGR03435 family)
LISRQNRCILTASEQQPGSTLVARTALCNVFVPVAMPIAGWRLLMRARLAVLLFALLGYTIATAQVPPTRAPQFEVASVTQNISGRAGGAIEVPPAGTVNFTNVMLRVLIRLAYEVDAYAESYRFDPGPYVGIIGRPSAGPQPDVPRWDVRATPPDNTQPAERRAMMRALLEDRFRLRVHREMRQMPVYALTVAREGRLGPNLAQSTVDCQAYLAQRRAGRAGEEPLDANGNSWCLFQGSMIAPPGVLIMRFAGSVRVLAQRLQPYVERPVVDATGLSGNLEWDLRFAWGPDGLADAPAVFAALREQLGLQLETRQAPVDVLVVDHVELPTPD